MVKGRNEKKIRKVIQAIKSFEGPFNVTSLAKKTDMNKMFLSGFLTTLSSLGVLRKRELGRTHIYNYLNEEKLEKLL